MHYRGTIEIPNDENWIVQGALGSDGIPVTLDARLSSGTAVDPSQASVVVRYTRFSGRTAPLDPHPEARVYGDGPGEYVGGAFKYDGGGRTMDRQTPLTFESVIFDHNDGMSGHGGGLFIDGRAGATRVDGVWGGIKWTMESVLFY